MSGQATGWVLRDGPRASDHDRDGMPYGLARARSLRAVLLTVADAANRDGHHAHPGVAAMVEGSLYSRRHVMETVGELIAEGWLVIEQEGGGRGRATVYGIQMDRRNGALAAPFPEDETVQPETVNGAEKVQFSEETVQSQVPDQGERAPNGLSTRNVEIQHPPTPQDRFDEFYAAYPRKRDPEAARRAWVKALRVADADTIIAGALRYAEERRGQDPQFTKHPSTWLNAGSWANTADAAAGPKLSQSTRSLAAWAQRREQDTPPRKAIG